MAQARTEILSLQYLRAMAAIAVAISHAAQIIPIHGRGDVFGPMPAGAAGVDVFFVISGFIMCHITNGTQITGWAFFKHRLARVAPSYWIITGLVAAVLIFAPSLFNTSVFDIPLLLSSLFFIPHVNPANGEVVPLLQIGWTLNYEFFYYTIFAIFLSIRPRYSAYFASGIIVLVCLLPLLSDHLGVLAFYSNTIVIEFIFGMISWKILDKMTAPHAAAGLTLVLLGCLGFYFSDYVFSGDRTSLMRPIGWGVPAWAIVTGAIIFERSGRLPKSKLLKKMGDASYAIYLTHIMTLGVVRFVWGHFHLKDIFADIYLLIFAIAAVIISSILYFDLVEKPVSRFFRRAM